MKKKIIVAYTCHGNYGCEIIKKIAKPKKEKEMVSIVDSSNSSGQ